MKCKKCKHHKIYHGNVKMKCNYYDTDGMCQCNHYDEDPTSAKCNECGHDDSQHGSNGCQATYRKLGSNLTEYCECKSFLHYKEVLEIKFNPEEPIMQFFESANMKGYEQDVAKPFKNLAISLLLLPRCAERTVALRKLLESKEIL